ncbi:MAG TPA: flagellar assembly protein FliH [Bryobacteraceae bacterium]|nr:flagellar assembly protein FliH [Bryobacteraceae bacterium]
MGSQILRGISAEAIEWRALQVPACGTPQPRVAERLKMADDANVERMRARIAELERDVQTREQRAWSAGHAKGLAEGRAEDAARIEAAIARLTNAAAEVASSRRKFRRDAEEDCVKLAVAVARRVLRRELTIDPEALLGIVKAALARLDGREIERIRLHPDDAALVEGAIKELPGRASLQIVADAALEPGACILETSRGGLDASVETQLREIERGLVDRIR